MYVVKQDKKVLMERPAKLFFGDDIFLNEYLLIAKLFKYIEGRKRNNVSANLGGFMAGKIVVMHAAGKVVDDNNQPIEKNI